MCIDIKKMVFYEYVNDLNIRALYEEDLKRYEERLKGLTEMSAETLALKKLIVILKDLLKTCPAFDRDKLRRKRG